MCYPVACHKVCHSGDVFRLGRGNPAALAATWVFERSVQMEIGMAPEQTPDKMQVRGCLLSHTQTLSPLMRYCSHTHTQLENCPDGPGLFHAHLLLGQEPCAWSLQMCHRPRTGMQAGPPGIGASLTQGVRRPVCSGPRVLAQNSLRFIYLSFVWG